MERTVPRVMHGKILKWQSMSTKGLEETMSEEEKEMVKALGSVGAIGGLHVGALYGSTSIGPMQARPFRGRRMSMQDMDAPRGVYGKGSRAGSISEGPEEHDSVSTRAGSKMSVGEMGAASKAGRTTYVLHEQEHENDPDPATAAHKPAASTAAAAEKPQQKNKE